MPWFYTLHVAEEGSGWALEVEDPTSERELVRRFDTAAAARANAQAMCEQLSETGDCAEVYVDGHPATP